MSGGVLFLADLAETPIAWPAPGRLPGMLRSCRVGSLSRLVARHQSSSLSSRRDRSRLFLELAKYRLSALVVVTSGAGFICSGRGLVDGWSLISLRSAGFFNHRYLSW